MNEQEKLQAIQNRDSSYDGKFIFGVKTTKIICRPGCPARLPLKKNIVFFGTMEEAIEKDDFEQLGLDSLSLYSLVDDAEQKFNVEIDTDDITEINSITKIFNYINNKRNE